jgi:CheY-like chemotaxis protein
MAHKLLLADDSVTIQRVIELTFADEDIDVTVVGDGQLAIERLDTDPPDIVLADVDMPKRDGYEVAAYVKSRPRLAHIPVVLLTGAFEPIDQARAAASGSSDVLAKPFEPQMVINRVKDLLGRKREPAGDDNNRFDGPHMEAPVFAPPLAPQSRQTARPDQGGTASSADRQATDAPQPISLDDYFDQLDAAFSNLHSPAGAPIDSDPTSEWPAAAKPLAHQEEARHDKSIGAITLEELDEAAFAPSSQSVTSLGAAPGAPSAGREAAGKPAAPPAPAAVAPLAPQAPVAPPVHAAPPIAPVAAAPPAAARAANPFAELSAVKAEAAVRPPAPVVTEEMIEEIVSRVLQRLSDRVVRETVAEIVSKTAERLVQEEIERIRGGQ